MQIGRIVVVAGEHWTCEKVGNELRTDGIAAGEVFWGNGRSGGGWGAGRVVIEDRMTSK